MCEFCGIGGRCAVCGADQDQPKARGVQRLAELRARNHEREIAETEARLRKLRAELPALLLAAGRRPGDGSDQGGLFDVEPVGLFSEVR